MKTLPGEHGWVEDAARDKGKLRVGERHSSCESYTELNGMETSECRNQQDALGSHADLVTEAQRDSLVTLAMVFIHVSSFPVCTDFLFFPSP